MLNGKKILLVGSYYFENLGDPLFMLTTKKLLEQKYHATVDIADIYGRTQLYVYVPDNTVHKPKKIGYLKKICKKALAVPYVAYIKAKNRYGMMKMYGKMVDGYDAVVIPGGGFISFSRTFPYHENIGCLAEICKKKGIDFCMNAVGVCRDVDRLFHEKAWKKILSPKLVKYIACRDGKELIEQVCGYPVEQVACTAVSAGDLYGIYRDEKSKTVGIGVIRGNAFSSYGYDFSEEQLIEFYADLGRELQKRGHDVKFFTNGLMTDYVIGQKVVSLMGDESLLLKRPETPEELVAQISGFKAVSIARLHAAITAFSLNVPTVLFCWGVKGMDFMEMAGASEYAVTAENMNVPYVIERLDRVMEKGWDQKQRRKLQLDAEESILKMCKILTRK